MSTLSNYINVGQPLQSFWFSIYGPMEIGTQIGQLLYGAFAISSIAYLHKCRTESWLHRGLVAALLFTAGLETLLADIQVIEYTAVHTADTSFISALAEGANAWVQPLVFSVTPLLCQVYMTLRVLLLARNKRRADPETKARGLMATGGLLMVLLLLAWGATYGAVIDTVVSRTSMSIGQFLTSTGDGVKIYRAMHAASVCLLLAVNFVITAATTAQLQFKRKGFFFTVVDGLMSLIVRNNLLVTLASGAQVAMVFAVSGWSTLIPLVIGKLYALTVLLIIASPAYSALSGASSAGCDLCTKHSHAISSSVKKCPACGNVLRRDTEMSIIPLSPKSREMSVFAPTEPEESDMGIPALHIRMNPPVAPRYSMDSQGPMSEKQL